MTYPGGKGGAGVYQQIINLMPPHRVYIEPFLGGGAILRAKRPAEINIGLDLDTMAITAFSNCGAPQSEITVGDGVEFLKSYRWQGGELVYFDPPYVREARRSARAIYKYEWTTQQHIDFLKVAKALPCMVMVSGYYSKLYARELKAWRVVTFQAVTRSGRMATEYVWLNFPEPLELHDYSFLGSNYIERQQIKRQRERWKKRLLQMPGVKRAALLSAIREIERENLQHS